MQSKTSRRAAWILGLAIGIGGVASFAKADAHGQIAKDEIVPLEKINKKAHESIAGVTKGASERVVHRVAEEGRIDFIVIYIKDGKEMKLRTGPLGRVIENGETKAQLHKDEMARIASEQDAAARARLESELSAKREAEDRAQLEAQRAQIAEQQAALDAANARAKAAGKPIVAAPASFQAVVAMSEEMNAKDRRPISARELPPAAKHQLDEETLGTTYVNYFKYSVGGREFYSAHYDISADRRIICRVDANGKLLGKDELKGAADYEDVQPGTHK